MKREEAHLATLDRLTAERGEEVKDWDHRRRETVLNQIRGACAQGKFSVKVHRLTEYGRQDLRNLGYTVRVDGLVEWK